MTLARTVAEWSKDPEQQVGCVLVSPDNLSIVLGYNGFPTAIKDDERLYNKEIKNKLMLHAEVMALSKVKRCVNWSVYVTKAPCTNCALQLIQAGVTTIYTPRPKGTWIESQQHALACFNEAGVTIKLIN